MNEKLTATSKRRLATLIKFMRALPKAAYAHFNMSGWVRGVQRDNIAGAKLTSADLRECGTSACAAGWGATISAFKRAGFTYEPATGQFSIHPTKFFGVGSRYLHSDHTSEDMESALFMNNARTPKEWAQMAERAVKRYERQTA